MKTEKMKMENENQKLQLNIGEKRDTLCRVVPIAEYGPNVKRVALPMTQDQNTTTDYGSFEMGSCTTVEAYVADVLGSYGDDYDQEGICAELRAAINDALPDGVTLNGNNFYGPYPRDLQETIDLEGSLEAIDAWGIVQRHEKTIDD